MIRVHENRSNLREFARYRPAHLLLFGAVLLAGCDPDLPRPRYAPQKTGALIEVGYPPPPGRVEFIPAQPKGDRVVWLDGEWVWSGSKWAWTAGRWVVAPPEATFSPWTTVRDASGTVYFASGVWNDATGRALPPPPPIASGRATGGDVTSSSGDDEKTGVAPPTSSAAPAVGARPDAGAAPAAARPE